MLYQNQNMRFVVFLFGGERQVVELGHAARLDQCAHLAEIYITGQKLRHKAVFVPNNKWLKGLSWLGPYSSIYVTRDTRNGLTPPAYRLDQAMALIRKPCADLVREHEVMLPWPPPHQALPPS